MTIKLGDYTVTIHAQKDYPCSHGIVEDTKSFLCTLACQLWEAEARYKEVACHALAREANVFALAIHNELEAVGYLEEVV